MKYWTAYAALVSLESALDRGPSWRNVLQVLEDKHVTGLQGEGMGEGSQMLSWIWMAPGVHAASVGEKGEKVQDSMCQYVAESGVCEH